MKLTKGQKAAVAAAVAGRNVFLTGEGGTGKSVAVEAIVEALKGKAVVLCAPTGVAAVNIDGVTIHKAFNFNTAPKVADELERVKPSKIIHAADCVIIDEVGMVRRDTMDAIGRVVRMENEARKETRRKPLQIIVVGDFFQLPPVAGDDEPALIEAYGPTSTGSSFFAFESDAWGMLDFQICMLDEVMRQKGDAAFVDALNQARLGDVACLPFFNGLTTAQKGEPPAEAVSVVPSKKKQERSIGNAWRRLARRSPPSTA